MVNPDPGGTVQIYRDPEQLHEVMRRLAAFFRSGPVTKPSLNRQSDEAVLRFARNPPEMSPRYQFE